MLTLYFTVMIAEILVIAICAAGIAVLCLWYRMHFAASVFVKSSGNRYHHDLVLCRHTVKCLHHLYKQAKQACDTPELADSIFVRLRYLLPDRGIYKTQRQQLHCIAEDIRMQLFKNLRQARDLSPEKVNSCHFDHFVNLHAKLEHIDWTAAEQEKRVDCTIRLTRNYIIAQHYARLPLCIDIARNIQHLNLKLLKDIYQMERQFRRISRKLRHEPQNITIATER